jgi:hypothetical protein
MLLAAEDRYREAEKLILEQEFDGAVYLLGYAVEMWLKAACLRLQTTNPLVQIKPSLAPIKNWMRLKAPAIPFTDFHDLSFLGEYLLRFRQDQGRPLAAAMRLELTSHIISGLHQEWAVEMRYRRAGLVASDAWSALLQAWWMKINWIYLF